MQSGGADDTYNEVRVFVGGQGPVRQDSHHKVEDEIYPVVNPAEALIARIERVQQCVTPAPPSSSRVFMRIIVCQSCAAPSVV